MSEPGTNAEWPPIGSLLASRYLLVALLETGGMAEIWRARDEVLERPVALKLPTNLRTRPESMHLAWREARMAARLSHPNIAAVHDYAEAVRPDGSVTPFVVMELLTGESLAARVERAPLTPGEAAAVAVPVADALSAAHGAGVVHRDIKPGNVMLTPTGVKILDFGISAALGEPDDDETGATFGTPAYVAPERLDGKPAEPATDVYGLGVLLFEMVTGEPPYPVDTWEELAAARVTGPGRLPADVPAAFRDLVGRCLAEDPADRPTAAEARRALAGLAEDTGAPAPPPPASTFAAGRAPAVTLDLQPPARRRIAVGAGAAALVLAIAGLVTALSASRETTDAGPPPVATAPSPVTSPAAPAASSPPASSPGASSPPDSSLPDSSPLDSPPPAADLADAVARVRSAVEDGRDAGRIRPDVAADLLNLLGPLRSAEAGEVDARLAEVRRKISDRVSEGGVAETQADVLRSRLAEVDRAAGA